jgi:hypothetical protein
VTKVYIPGTKGWRSPAKLLAEISAIVSGLFPRSRLRDNYRGQSLVWIVVQLSDEPHSEPDRAITSGLLVTQEGWGMVGDFAIQQFE